MGAVRRYGHTRSPCTQHRCYAMYQAAQPSPLLVTSQVVSASLSLSDERGHERSPDIHQRTYSTHPRLWKDEQDHEINRYGQLPVPVHHTAPGSMPQNFGMTENQPCFICSNTDALSATCVSCHTWSDVHTCVGLLAREEPILSTF